MAVSDNTPTACRLPRKQKDMKMRRMLMFAVLCGACAVIGGAQSVKVPPVRVGYSRIYVAFSPSVWEKATGDAAPTGFPALWANVAEEENAGEQASRALEALASCYDNPQYQAECKNSAHVLAHFGVSIQPAGN